MRSADFVATHPLFTHEEYLAAHGARGDRSPRTADSLLTRHAAAGKVLHVRRGLYASVPAGAAPDTFQVDPFLLATKLAPDAAVACHAALQFRGKAYSMWHRFAALTRSHVRPLVFQGSEFVGVRPPRALDGHPDLGGGIVSESHAGGTVRVTSFERTLVGVLDAPILAVDGRRSAPELLTTEPAMQAVIQEHPDLKWKALNVKKRLGTAAGNEPTE